jgi:activator of HSP90 ATPase
MCKTIKQKVKFKAPPKTVYDLLVDAKKHQAFTKQRAKLPKRIGARFSTYSGHCSGIIVDLAPGRRIVQAWRSRQFPAGIFSMATFNLKPVNGGGCELVLTHRGVPKDLIPGIERGWREFYWAKMKAYLGE